MESDRIQHYVKKARKKLDVALLQSEMEAARKDFDFVSDIAIELDELARQWLNEASERCAFLMAWFEQLPAYGVLMYMKHSFAELNETDKATILSSYATWLRAGSEAHKAAVSYSLWVDMFEDTQSSSQSWRVLTHPDYRDLLAEILPLSGPVPWPEKRQIYHSAVFTENLQEPLLLALRGCVYDACGKLDPAEALQLLSRLQSSSSLKQELQVKLKGYGANTNPN
jgi:hypothetical protein